MQYEIQIKPQAIKDGKRIPKKELRKIFAKIDALKDGLQGNVRRLTNFTPEYRLRVGNYRVLFEIETDVVMIYRIKHRREAYK
jgi:mRNA interferase RelE/StbE